MPLVLLWPSLVGDRTFVPWDIAQFPPAATLMDESEFRAATERQNMVITETPVMFIPELRFLKSEFDRGCIPHWNPYSRSGTVAWSSSIIGMWYPPNWIKFVGGDPQDDLALGAYLSLVIAGLLMFGLLTHLGVSAPGAVFGAMVFSLSGTLTANLGFYQRVDALVWLPGLFWAISAISRREGCRRIPAILGLTGCMFMAHVAGFPAFALAVSLLSIALAVHLLVGRMRRDGFGSMVNLGLAIGCGAVLGVLMSMVQTLPMFEFFPQSQRTLEPAGNALASGGFDPAGWLGYFCPTIFNHPHINFEGGLRDQYSPLFWYLYSRSSWEEQGQIAAGTVFDPSYNFCEYTVFVGTLTLFLAFAGLCNPKLRLRFLAASLLGLLVLGSTATAAIGPILEMAPFRWIPAPRFMGPVCMFVGFLAAGGVQSLHLLSAAVRRVLWIGGYLLSIAFASLAWWASARTPAELLAALRPGLVAKYSDRHPALEQQELVSFIESLMGPDMPMAQSHMVDNFTMAAVATFVSASLFLALPLILRRRYGLAAVVGLAFVTTGGELLRFGIPLNEGRILQRRPLNETPVHEFLRRQRDKYVGAGGFSVMRAHDSTLRTDPLILPAQLPPDTLLEERIRDQQAYTFVDNRSHLPLLKLYGIQGLIRGTWPMSIADNERLALPYWDMLGVRFILSEDRLKHAGALVGPILSGPEKAEKKTRHFYTYERAHPLPRAWIVYDARVLGTPEGLLERTHSGSDAGDPTEDAIVSALIDPKFRPADEVILDQPTAAAVGFKPPPNPTPGNTRLVSFPIPYETSELTIDVEAGEPGYLIVNDTFISGWSVTVGDETSTIHRANLFQRMVRIPAGKVRVKFRYITPGFYPGLILFGFSMVVVIVLFWRYLAGERRSKSVDATP